ncbi:hypothetical protein [Streptomyces sp. NPDC005093]
MFNTYMKYSAVLIGLYLAVSHASGAGSLLKNGAAGLSTVTRSLQGRK